MELCLMIVSLVTCSDVLLSDWIVGFMFGGVV